MSQVSTLFVSMFQWSCEGCPTWLQASQNDIILPLVGGCAPNPPAPSGAIFNITERIDAMLKRNNQMLFRVNTDEYFQIHRNAQQSGNSLAAYIRRCCLSDEKVIVIDRRVVRDVYREMNSIGKNINQITKVANSDKRISPASMDRVEAFLAEIWKIVDEQLGGIRMRR